MATNKERMLATIGKQIVTIQNLRSELKQVRTLLRWERERTSRMVMDKYRYGDYASGGAGNPDLPDFTGEPDELGIHS